MDVVDGGSPPRPADRPGRRACTTTSTNWHCSTSTTTRCRSPSQAPRTCSKWFLRHFAGYVDKPHGTSSPVNGSFDVNLIEREPYGVVGVITPWNGALAVAALVCGARAGGRRTPWY